MTFTGRYRVIHLKVFHKSEEKMHEKMKMHQQKNKNLVLEQHQHGTCFCKKEKKIPNHDLCS